MAGAGWLAWALNAEKYVVPLIHWLEARKSCPFGECTACKGRGDVLMCSRERVRSSFLARCAVKDEGFVIVIQPESAKGYAARTYRVKEKGLLAVIAVLEEPPTPFDVVVRAAHLHVRRTPGGEPVGMLASGEVVRVHPPTQEGKLGACLYEWGRIREPLDGWIALGKGLAERLSP